MKVIIEGKLYNTDSAHELAEVIISDEWESWQMTETLYRKTNGEFFLWRDFCGDGDAIAEYQWVLNHRCEPLSDEKARTWAERHIDVNAYIDLFGEPVE